MRERKRKRNGEVQQRKKGRREVGSKPRWDRKGNGGLLVRQRTGVGGGEEREEGTTMEAERGEKSGVFMRRDWQHAFFDREVPIGQCESSPMGFFAPVVLSSEVIGSFSITLFERGVIGMCICGDVN